VWTSKSIPLDYKIILILSKSDKKFIIDHG
jgi:hypothetical protein